MTRDNRMISDHCRKTARPSQAYNVPKRARCICSSKLMVPVSLLCRGAGLGLRGLSTSPGSLLGGLVCLAVGLWLFPRSHADLGTNWSITLEVREQHQLVTEGMNRHVRHPMYLALLVYSVGQALVVPNWIAGSVATRVRETTSRPSVRRCASSSRWPTVDQVADLEQVVAASLAGERFEALLAAAFAILGLARGQRNLRRALPVGSAAPPGDRHPRRDRRRAREPRADGADRGTRHHRPRAPVGPGGGGRRLANARSPALRRGEPPQSTRCRRSRNLSRGPADCPSRAFWLNRPALGARGVS